MGILAWLRSRSLSRRKSSEVSEQTTEDVEQLQDDRKADIGGTLFVRGSAHSEAERLSSDD